MSNFFRKTGVKAVCAVLCIVCLTAASASGVALLALLWNDAYDASSMFTAAAQSALREDGERIMYGYFDPDDPAHPWVSYYTGGIYTGENSNFIYRVVDDETGKTVLSSYTGTPEVRLHRDYTYSFEEMVENSEATLEESYQLILDVPIFECAGTVYAYSPENDWFYPIDEDTTVYLTDPPEELSAEALYLGFVYGGNTHYAYDGSSFYPDYSLPEVEYTYVTHSYTISCYLLADLPYSDGYRKLYNLSYALFQWQQAIWMLFGVSLILGMVLLIILGCTVGRRSGQREAELSLLNRIPMDAALFLCGFAAVSTGNLVVNPVGPRHLAASLGLDGLLLLGVVTLSVYLITSLCAHVKTGTTVSTSLIFWLLSHLGDGIRAVGGLVGKLLGYLPLLWKVIVCYGVICLFEAFVLAVSDTSFGVVFLWLIGRLIGLALVCYVALSFRRLKTGAETIAAGDYNSRVDTKRLVLDFKDTAETLNHIGDGMNAAVDDRIRSERMKTELITNVSHDLKTPLTSIVSYVDLLKQELGRAEAVSREAQEYLAVLDRQSARLKKLIEDLVEASKASTGNLNLQLETLDFGMLLGQALGEYAPRLSAANLTLMTRLPESPVLVRADGRRLWRVFDNLLGNAVKYAMPGTRLYLNVDQTAETVTATFRNISWEPLDVGADELMERFVRGDVSRHTEGSGLGLSIARSLTESMGGQFRLEVDGDLFKAMVTLPVLAAALPAQKPEGE